MRVCYFYAKRFEPAIASLPQNAELIYTGENPWQYWWSLASVWGSGEDLVTVEQDNIITEDILAEYAECDKSWCVNRYPSGPRPGDWLIEKGLGCAKFSAELQELVTVDDILAVSCWLRMICNYYPRSGGITCTPSQLCWIHIDCPVAKAISERGIDRHTHEAIVDHIHDW